MLLSANLKFVDLRRLTRRWCITVPEHRELPHARVTENVLTRRDPDERKAHKKAENDKAKRDQEQEQEQEQDQQKEKGKEPEHARAQNQVGNAALAAMMNAGPGGRGGGGVEVEMSKKKADMEKEGQGFGGEDDEGDPVAMLDGDLAEAWNPTTVHPSERLAFLEAMPEDELPPEDDALIEAILALGDLPPLPESASIEPLVQPSAEVLAVSTQTWTRAVARFVGPSLASRAWARLVTNPGPLLQDPGGRVLILRARTSSLAANALLHGPALAERDVATTALIGFALELEARSWRVRAGRLALGDNTARALARNTLEMVLTEADRLGRVEPRRVDDASLGALHRALNTLLDVEDPHGLVPRNDDSHREDEDEDDDPLGLDAVIAEFTGGVQDPREGVYRAFLQAADKVANAIYLTRVRIAGVAVAVADTAKLWTNGAPGETLLDVMSDFDASTGEIIALLKDVARAANKRNVALRTLRAWLDKAADNLVDATTRALDALACTIAGILPENPRVPAFIDAPSDALGEAWGDGTPDRALPWIGAQPTTLDRDAAAMFTRFAVAWEPQGLADALVALRDRANQLERVYVEDAFGTLLGAVLLAEGRYAEAQALGRERFGPALERRNGVVAAEAALLEIDALYAAGQVPEAEARRLQTAAQLAQIGARGALTLLARWLPPVHEE